ncbi:MAG: DNA repair protein RadC [Planctomycetota bacterium]|nr:DNA repair protein RadC [Planctomycetota bacterium]
MKRVQDLPPHNRPREKLQERGAAALTEAELVAAILGSGGSGRDVMSLAKAVAQTLADRGGKPSFDDLARLPGIGIAKAAQILAALELARRYGPAAGEIKIKGPEDAFSLFWDIAVKPQEHFAVISLNGANAVIAKRNVTVGLLDRSQVHPREVFAEVIAERAAAVIFGHNHPSGELTPSEADLQIHRQLCQAAEILGIRVLDHLVVSRKGFLSFQSQGLL